jgi:hypothetical protein
MGNDNVLMEFLIQEANACKDWIKQSDGRSFELFYTKVLNSLREIGIQTLNPIHFYDIPLKQRLAELDRLESNHRLELEAAFIAVWLSKDMKQTRDDYHKRVALKAGKPVTF